MKHTTYNPSNTAVTAIKTALKKLDLFSEAYGLEPVDSEGDWMHDLPIILDHGYLLTIRLELVDKHTRKVVQQYVQKFDPKTKRLLDGDSIESLPRVIPNRKLNQRVIITHPNGTDEKAYSRYLRSWYTTPEKLGREDTHECQARDSDGNIRGGQLSVSDNDLRKIVIKRSLGGYAFAEDLADQTSVFVHRSELPVGEHFIEGQRYRAIVMSSPKGLMACALKPL